MKKIYLAAIDDAANAFMLLEQLPDIHAWLKDVNGNFVYANALFYQRFGYNHVEQLIGKNDFDLSPHHIASDYVEDDHLVLSGGVVTDRLELIIKHNGEASWFITSKWPVYDFKNIIIGTYGISRHLNKSNSISSPFRDLNAPIEYIHQHFNKKITVKRLAAYSNLSISALERRFQKHLGKSPRQYIIEVRLEHAKKLVLETTKSLAVIALETGFSDQSHFTHSYKKRFSLSPSHERKQVK